MSASDAASWQLAATLAGDPGAESLLRFTARQPILDADGKIFGYELLFRDGIHSYCSQQDFDAAARATVDASLLEGLEVLCDGHRAFVNCTREALVYDYAMLLPKGKTVVEVLESVGPDEEVVAACRRLKEAGYLLALDDFTANDPRMPLTEFADIIKVDVRLTSPEQRAELVQQLASTTRIMLAEKVETREEFLTALKHGFGLFQGYFFRTPEVITTKEIPANQLNYVLLLQASARAELDWDELEGLLKGEAALTYRLLRFLNSPVFGLKTEVSSIRQGLVLLGEREARRWIRLAATVGLARRHAGDLLLNTLARARFCELIAPRVRADEAELFLIGLLSLMDAMLGLPISVVLNKVPLPKETKALLLGEPSRLTPVYELMLANEAGEWERVAELCSQLKIEEGFAAECNWRAMQWAHHISRGL